MKHSRRPGPGHPALVRRPRPTATPQSPLNTRYSNLKPGLNTQPRHSGCTGAEVFEEAQGVNPLTSRRAESTLLDLNTARRHLGAVALQVRVEPLQHPETVVVA